MSRFPSLRAVPGDLPLRESSPELRIGPEGPGFRPWDYNLRLIIPVPRELIGNTEHECAIDLGDFVSIIVQSWIFVVQRGETLLVLKDFLHSAALFD